MHLSVCVANRNVNGVRRARDWQELIESYINATSLGNSRGRCHVENAEEQSDKLLQPCDTLHQSQFLIARRNIECNDVLLSSEVKMCILHKRVSQHQWQTVAYQLLSNSNKVPHIAPSFLPNCNGVCAFVCVKVGESKQFRTAYGTAEL